MSTTNNGNQIISFDFKHIATGRNFNTLLRNILKPGIYSGGTLSKIDNSTIAISPFDAWFDVDTDKSCHISTSTPVQLTVTSAYPVLYMIFNWSDSENNFIDFLFRAVGSPVVTNEIQIGVVGFTGPNVNGTFDYANRTYGLYDESYNLYASENIYSDDIFEKTLNHGVNIENVNFKDGVIWENIKVITNDNWVITDTDPYSVYVFTGLTADKTLTFPTLADNQARKFAVHNLTGTYKVICTPEGTDLLNDWNSTFEITEKGGRLECLALSTHWECTPNENCSIYRVESEVADTGLTLDGTWDDVAGMALTLPSNGIGYCSSFCRIYAGDSGLVEYIDVSFGLGTLTGNNAPNIRGSDHALSEIRTTVNNLYGHILDRNVMEFKLSASAQTVYMKIKSVSNELNLTQNQTYVSTNDPMLIQWRRTR